MGSSSMKQLIVGISLLASIAFLLMSIVATWQVFTILVSQEGLVRSELWIFLILCFTGGVIMLSMAWGIAEIGDRRNNPRVTTASNDDEE